jgi:hypothetical protein
MATCPHCGNSGEKPITECESNLPQGTIVQYYCTKCYSGWSDRREEGTPAPVAPEPSPDSEDE